METLGSRLPTRAILARLIALRYAVAALLAASAVALRLGFGIALPIAPLAAGFAALLAVYLHLHLRVRAGRPATERDVFLNFAAEMLVLTAILHVAGGSASPLVSVYLLPLTVAANLLERRHTWTIAVLAATCYTFLLWIDVPTTSSHAGGHGGEHGTMGFQEHVVGMWAMFVVSAGLVAHFVSSLAQSVRERDRELAEAREEVLRSERIVALGTLGAGAAHDLGTPLATMSVLAEDMARRHVHDREIQADVSDLQTQISRCKDILGELAEASGVARGERVQVERADAVVERALERWRLLRPEASATFRWSGEAAAPPLVADRTLEQALLNLLNNAADASPRAVAVSARAEAGRIVVDILDDGPGLTDEVRSRAGEPFFSTKRPAGGMGIGLFLANATIERLGGSVELLDRPEGGCCTRVTLPALAGSPA